jgi:hypothetical protein
VTVNKDGLILHCQMLDIEAATEPNSVSTFARTDIPHTHTHINHTFFVTREFFYLHQNPFVVPCTLGINDFQWTSMHPNASLALMAFGNIFISCLRERETHKLYLPGFRFLICIIFCHRFLTSATGYSLTVNASAKVTLSVPPCLLMIDSVCQWNFSWDVSWFVDWKFVVDSVRGSIIHPSLYMPVYVHLRLAVYPYL